MPDFSRASGRVIPDTLGAWLDMNVVSSASVLQTFHSY